jgi:methylation protein EvaC
MSCRFCGHELKEIVSFGEIPIANGFVKSAGDSVSTFEQVLSVCSSCLLVQLRDQPDEEAMFHENYAYLSSLSTYMTNHFAQTFDSIKDEYLNDENSVIVELGCNDGIFLKNAVKYNINHLGFEPSRNVADLAREKGINVSCEFFTKDNAAKRKKELGEANVVYSANVFCHIPYINDIIDGLSEILCDSGVFIFEDPYLLDIMKKTSYDQIYDEHAFYFSLISVSNVFEHYGFEIIDAKPLNVHGGSMRYVLGRVGKHEINPIVEKLKSAELEFGLDNVGRLLEFKNAVEQSKKTLVNKLKEYKEQGLKVAGYGATSKSTTILNYCNIDSDLISYISDTSPTKQGKYTPGTNIPIVSHKHFASSYPDIAVLFAWNHAREIWAKEGDFKANGGVWVSHIDESML